MKKRKCLGVLALVLVTMLGAGMGTLQMDKSTKMERVKAQGEIAISTIDELANIKNAEVDKGPDQYAGQVFKDHLGRNIMISWTPGWKYKRFAEKDIGCMSVPRELKLENGRITAYPVKELQHLLKNEDEAVKRTENGFIIERTGREPVIYNGEITDLKILRDGYLVEVFVNGGAEVYTALL